MPKVTSAKRKFDHIAPWHIFNGFPSYRKAHSLDSWPPEWYIPPLPNLRPASFTILSHESLVVHYFHAFVFASSFPPFWPVEGSSPLQWFPGSTYLWGWSSVSLCISPLITLLIIWFYYQKPENIFSFIFLIYDSKIFL